MKFIIQLSCALILVIYGIFVCSPLYAADAFTSAEIKKVRYLSQALLKSRANEKKRLEEELQPMRAQIDEMYSALEPLTVLKVQTSFTPVAKPVIQTSLNPPSSLSPSQTTTTAGNNNEQSQTSVAQAQATQKARRDISNAASKLKATRTIIEKDLPKLREIWKTKTARDKRNEQLAEVVKEVENELAIMERNGQVDIKTVKALRQKLSLSRPEISIDEIEPTFQTKTRHREINPGKIK